MLVLINVDNLGRPLGGETLDQVRELRADGVRVDIATDPGRTEAQLKEFADNGDLQLLALVHGRQMPGRRPQLVEEALHVARIAFENFRMKEAPRPPIFELGNEPTVSAAISRWPADEFGKAVAEGAREIWRVGGSDTLVISGGIHNIEKGRIEYIEDAARHFPKPEEGRFAIGFHHYPKWMGDPNQAPKGFSSATAAIERLKRLGYDLFDTESGSPANGKVKHTRQDIARWLERRLDLSERWGLLGSVVFQLKDGPDPNDFESSFGLLTIDGRRWPAADTLERWVAAAKDRRPAPPDQGRA